MLPGLSEIERADSEKVWDDFFWSESGNMFDQTVSDALEQKTVFIIANPDMSDHKNDTCHDTPIQRLIKMVNVTSPKALTASMRDIESIVCMADRIASSPPVKNSKAEIGNDLVGTIASCLRKRCFSRFGGTNRSKNTKPGRSPKMYASSIKLMDVENFGLNSIFSRTERPRIEMLPVEHALLEEIRNINKQLIDTVVSICDKDTMTIERSEGIIVKCSFIAMAVSPNLTTRQSSAPEFPVHPLKLLVPESYPRCSPIFKTLHVEACPDKEHLSFKAMEKFNNLVQSFPNPFSVSEVARTWDLCARAVVLEFARHHGGGSFSSKYGAWEDCTQL